MICQEQLICSQTTDQGCCNAQCSVCDTVRPSQPAHLMRCCSKGSHAAWAAAAATPSADTSMPVTWAPILATGSLSNPPPQPTSRILRPARGSALLGLRPRKLHKPCLRKLHRAVLRACRAAKGPLDVSHHWSASAANLAASRLSSEL
jgi:hypothetical protein